MNELDIGIEVLRARYRRVEKIVLKQAVGLNGLGITRDRDERRAIGKLYPTVDRTQHIIHAWGGLVRMASVETSQEELIYLSDLHTCRAGIRCLGRALHPQVLCAQRQGAQYASATQRIRRQNRRSRRRALKRFKVDGLPSGYFRLRICIDACGRVRERSRWRLRSVIGWNVKRPHCPIGGKCRQCGSEGGKCLG